MNESGCNSVQYSWISVAICVSFSASSLVLGHSTVNQLVSNIAVRAAATS